MHFLGGSRGYRRSLMLWYNNLTINVEVITALRYLSALNKFDPLILFFKSFLKRFYSLLFKNLDYQWQKQSSIASKVVYSIKLLVFLENVIFTYLSPGQECNKKDRFDDLEVKQFQGIFTNISILLQIFTFLKLQRFQFT